MAKQVWNNPIDKHTDWGGDPVKTDGLPVSGEMVQKFIKDALEGKAGLFWYDATNNRYLVFADADARDEYLADPSKTELIIGTFDAPFNYTAEISLNSSAYNAVFLGSAGNYIDFTFDIKNKQGASTGENVTVTYTFIRNATRQEVKETRKYGDAVRFNVDKYLGEGTNTVIVGIVGQTSLAATTVAITYQVVNLVLTDGYNISNSYNLSNGAKRVEVPFTVSGYGTKIVEWYLDGELLPFVKSEDEVVDVIATRTKYIEIANLQQGTHSLQLRAYTVVNGEQFYTDTLYRDIMVYTGANSNVILGVAVTIPRQYGILGANDRVSIYDMIQFVPYTLRFATYSPFNAANTEVVVSLDGKEMGRVGSVNNVENRFVITPSTAGTKTLKLSAPGVTKEYQAVIKETDMDIAEIDSGLVLNFTAEGKTYNSPDRDHWTDGVHNAVLSGFNWNATSGWWNGKLEMSAGSSIEFDYAPLSGNPTNTGKTIEIEWSTKNVTNDDAVICDLRGDNGVGILITATKVSMKSADGVVVETEYKSDENVRIGFVINQSSGTTNQRLSFIYANGIVSRGEKWAQADSYTSDKLMKFTATEEAEISLKSIRIYDTALTSDNMLNNYILYRDTVSQMLEVYDRNDVYEEGTTTFSPDKMMGRLPVMIVTGDIPVLENTSDKDTQIVVDIEYYNMQDTSKSFRMTGAAMRPQGTSSMGYPKKNFRIYTQKVENTEVYDADGKLIEDKLYSFKEGAQPVNCWCLKADYAESSGTHNTGIARLWNEALMNAQIEGEYVCRTGAQKAALAAKYEYDVRTTIDGFPILLFYRPSANDDVIFIGKYNFNNDKSTESVFGFTGIPGFNNERMQCWEVLNNGNPLALFTTVANFDRDWAEAFESRYPDTKTPYTGDLKAFCQWMVNVSQADFATEKWQHLNVYMMAAYWCYLMRHAAADQFVKNAMFTSEDGQHFYYILYDNDTINGLINTGRLRIKPTDDRQTIDETGSYVFAGHDSRLWNMLENDEEFISIVSAVDNALYSAGISYANTIKIFDEEQADKWVERVYNQDAQYKYVGPYVEKGIDNLFMLQGKRDLHRRWWLAKRFSIYDAKYVSGMYKSQAIEIKCLNGTVPGQRFSIVAGYPLDYGYGINDVPRTFGVSLNVGDKHTFETRETINLGDPVRIYAAPHLSEVDFSLMSDRLAVVTIANVYDESLGTKLTRLILGNANKVNAEVTEISGLKQAMALEYLDVQGMTKINSLDLSNHQYFKILKAMGSGISSVAFANGAPVERLELPATMRVLSLAQLPHLASDNVVLENIANLQSISILACPNLSDDFDFVYDWIDSKTTDDRYCSLVMDGVDWHLSNADKFMRLLALKTNGGTFSIKGKVRMDTIKIEQIYAIRDTLGESSFDPNAELYVDIPSVLQINAEDSVLEGNNLLFTTSLYPYLDGTYTWSLESGRAGCTIDQNGLLTTEETALDTSDVVIKVRFVSTDGEVLTATKTVSVVRRTYPQNIIINGASDPRESAEYTWDYDTEGVNGEYSVVWSLEGGMTSYWRIASSDSQRCVLEKTGAMPNSVSGTIKVTIVREFDKGVASTGSLALSLPVVFPANATIEGNINPMEGDHTYTWYTTTNGVNGEFYARWELSGEITNFVEIASQNDNSCIIEIINAATDVIDGELTLTLYKEANNEIIVVVTKSLAAMMEGVVISSSTNAPIQEALYRAGLVANAKYSLLEEIEKITAEQLGRGEEDYSKPIFYSVRTRIKSFDEFQFFTGVTRVPKYLFYEWEKMEHVILPNSITTIGYSSFTYCKSLKELEIPESVTALDAYIFGYCRQLSTLKCFPLSAPTVGAQNTFGGEISYIGSDATGDKLLFVPSNATGYEEGYWLDPLQNSGKCGFKIYGKLIIKSNKPSAKFTVVYTSVNGETETQNLNAGTSYLNDIQYGTNVTIRVVSGGIPEEGVEKTFVYNDANITHTFTFAREGSWITIDQTIIDSDTMISGDVNGEHIQAIRNNSHRYLGKYTASGQMTICQLADHNSDIYADGTTAVLSGGEGDVFVRLPRFWYASVEKTTDVWEIGFYYGVTAPKESYWKEWDGKDLLGAFVQSKPSNAMLRSVSGLNIYASSLFLSYNDCVSYANKRGVGFSFMPMKWYNILSLLFYAKYGTTSFHRKFPSTSENYYSGKTSSVGMSDTQVDTVNNLWGVEGLVASAVDNFISNVLVDYVSPKHVWKITEEDGTTRNVSGSDASSGYIMKMSFGDNGDMVPTEIDTAGYGSNTTGYGTILARAASSNRVLSISLGRYITTNKPNNNSYAHGRLAFRGTIIEESDPAVFKSLTAIG